MFRVKSRTITGKIYVVGDNVDTDQIIPAQYLNLVPTIPEEYDKLGSYALIGLPDEYPPFVKEGEMKSEFSILVAGKNFGCGSSREHAPVALASAGIQAVIAESYARIFFRNSIATGELYPCESEGRLCNVFRTGDVVEVDIDKLTMTQQKTGHSFNLKSLGAVAPVVDAGGIFAYARQTGMIAKQPGDTPEVMVKTPEPTPAAPVAAPKRPSRTRIIALANQKGGVG
jgi:3-isopropylmalate/(R)-2-methylmalate dehydratase small subunit